MLDWAYFYSGGQSVGSWTLTKRLRGAGLSFGQTVSITTSTQPSVDAEAVVGTQNAVAYLFYFKNGAWYVQDGYVSCPATNCGIASNQCRNTVAIKSGQFVCGSPDTGNIIVISTYIITSHIFIVLMTRLFINTTLTHCPFFVIFSSFIRFFRELCLRYTRQTHCKTFLQAICCTGCLSCLLAFSCSDCTTAVLYLKEDYYQWWSMLVMKASNVYMLYLYVDC